MFSEWKLKTKITKHWDLELWNSWSSKYWKLSSVQILNRVRNVSIVLPVVHATTNYCFLWIYRISTFKWNPVFLIWGTVWCSTAQACLANRDCVSLRLRRIPLTKLILLLFNWIWTCKVNLGQDQNIKTTSFSHLGSFATKITSVPIEIKQIL